MSSLCSGRSPGRPALVFYRSNNTVNDDGSVPAAVRPGRERLQCHFGPTQTTKNVRMFMPEYDVWLRLPFS